MSTFLEVKRAVRHPGGASDASPAQNSDPRVGMTFFPRKNCILLAGVAKKFGKNHASYHGKGGAAKVDTWCALVATGAKKILPGEKKSVYLWSGVIQDFDLFRVSGIGS